MAEPHQQLKNGTVFKFVKDYWFILLFIVGLAMGWAKIQASVEANRITNERQEASIGSLSEKVVVNEKEDAVSHQRIMTNEETLKEIKLDLKAILEAVK